MIHLLLAAQLDGHRHAAGLLLAPRRIPRAKTLPRQAAGFIKRVAPALLRQQHGVNTEESRQNFRLALPGRVGVKVQNRLVIAVQIEHQIGIAGEAQQMVAQGLRLAHGGKRRQRLPHRRAHPLQILGARTGQIRR